MTIVVPSFRHWKSIKDTKVQNAQVQPGPPRGDQEGHLAPWPLGLRGLISKILTSENALKCISKDKSGVVIIVDNSRDCTVVNGV